MKITNRALLFGLLAVIIIFSVQCRQESGETTVATPNIEQDRVFKFALGPLRLGDGVPLSTEIYLRWKIDDRKAFFSQFASADTFQQLILYPRSHELAKLTAGQFESVDSVFYGQRAAFLDAIKSSILAKAGETNITIKEVIIADLVFPASYTHAMEKAGLHRQELELIEQKSKVALAEAVANRERAKAEAKLRIVQEEANARVELIKAKTEKNKRQNALAKEETRAQIKKRQTKAEAENIRLLAKAEADRKRFLAKAELEKQQQQNEMALEQEQQVKAAVRKDEIEMAKLYQDYPNYATTMVNKQLASHVKIAVLPSESNQEIFKSLFEKPVWK
ncbi:MAG TPA: hypothetical protein ENK85_02530 [Saprospiraceae bacterium]|nr:hypothetical protein [Saprospiraceae bacterium]